MNLRSNKSLGVVSLVALLCTIWSLPVVAEKVLIGIDRLAQVGVILADVDGAHLRSFSHVSVVLADVPSEKVKDLPKLKGVRYVEADAATKQLGEVFPWGVERVLGFEEDLVWGKSTGEKVAVVVMDTGVDGAHEDLNLNKTYGFTARSIGGDWSRDLNGHGTHVAGVVAALKDDGLGVVGVAPQASLFSVKVLDDLGSGTVSALIEGLEWVIENRYNLSHQGRVVANISLGTKTDSLALREAVQAAYDAGILLVAAAGNDGNKGGSNDKIQYPAAYPAVIAVGATNKEDVRATFSSTGPTLELMAPGTEIVSTWRGGVCNSVYECWAANSGTSAAAPHVSGVAALVWADSPNWSNFQIRERLGATAEPVGDGDPNRYGRGLVNAARALGVNGYKSGKTGALGATAEVKSDKKDYFTITVSAVDTKNNSAPVPGGIVTLTVATPVGSSYTVEGYTDSAGLAKFEWKVRQKDGTGTYGIRAYVDKAGYVGTVATGAFEVQ